MGEKITFRIVVVFIKIEQKTTINNNIKKQS